MLLQKIKWMVIGMAITAAGVWLYTHRDSFSNLTGGSKNQGLFNKVNPEFAGYISAFTTGYISTGSTIKIKLSSEFGDATELNKSLDKKYFSFDPEIEGETIWKDGQTLEFRPKEKLKQGQLYKATFYLGELLEVKKELKEFEFQFKTIEQSLSLECNNLKSYHGNDLELYSLAGSVSSADRVSHDDLNKIVSAHAGSKTYSLKWVHNEQGTLHKFLIDSIERPGSGSSELSIDCNGEAIGVKYQHLEKFKIPAKQQFQFIGVNVGNDNEQFVQVTFSNPLDQNQSLEGLIVLTKPDNTESRNDYEDNNQQKDIKYIISNNQVLIYPNNLKSGSYLLTIDPSVKDCKGQSLSKETKVNVVFTEAKPAIRFASEGNILPSTNGMNLPFETVNLRAVDVKIFRIYENNVLQFLQNNDMDGSSQMAQVGKKIVEKRINLGLTNPSDFGVWKRSVLDLSSLIKTEPGAIYKVYLSMRKSYSTYPCLGNGPDEKFEMEEIKEKEEEEENFYGYYYDDYYSGYSDEGEDEDYDWQDRHNPCKSYYYRQYDRTVSKSILASDIGLTVKKGNDGSFLAVVNDLITTKPEGGVTIEMYDYQKQLILSAETNKDGQVFLNPVQRPYFIIAKKDKQRSYLKLDDGTTLSLSMYDVNGDAVKKGLKGFIYGERGVWRPGDSLFLSFILEDKQEKLPTNHPVVMELKNPQGQLYKRLLSNKNINGFFNFSTVTDKNVPTGNWTAEVKVGSVRFYKNLRIETIMPNRLKIEINTENQELISGIKPTRFNLHTQWLTGATARNLAANVNAVFTPAETSFPDYKNFIFEDVTARFETQNITVFDGKVDENGNSSFLMNLDLKKNAPGFLKASFTTRVFEQGGAFSIDRFSIPYSPYSSYCGIKLPEGERNSGILYTGKDHFIEIATVDMNGKGVNRDKLKFELYKLEWRWWWDQYNDELANFSADEYHKPVMTEMIKTKSGKARVKVNINENQWGRYLVRVTDQDGGHVSSTVTYFDWANWMERDGGEGNKIISSMLKFTTDKTAYKTEEEVTVNIPSPQDGRALVTIENGSKVLEAHWLITEKGTTKFKFKITPQMAPNVYVHVSLIQPHSRENDLPIRLYGVAPISIDDPETHLRPKINMANVLAPEKLTEIEVSEENGKEMAFTLAMVDEGLLDITRFKTPDPWKHFYAREALGVKTWDVYDRVIGAFGTELEKILSIGGDGSEAGQDDGAKANRFKPMVRFFGPFVLKKGEKKKIEFQMPLYVGSVRTMVIAGNKTAYGMAEKTTPVKAPLMLLGTLPRVLSVGEEVKLPVTIFGGDKNIGKTDVKVEVSGPIALKGSNIQGINIGKDDEKMVTFDVKVKEATGIAKVKITANGGGHKASYEMELDVRNPNPFQTAVKDMIIDAGKEFKENYKAIGVAGTNKAVLELSTIPPVNMDDRLHYLITYPHGCVEQTTSQSFAQLYLNDILDMSSEKKAEVERNVRAGIQELSKFQLANGAMSYWQGMNEANDWGTTYAGHFLILAEQKGYTLPPNFRKNWLNYQNKTAMNFELNKNSHYYSYDFNQAYRLYVLSLAGQPAQSAMNRLREYSQLSNPARWMLAAAYAQSGKIDEAEKLIAGSGTDAENYRVNYYTYGSSERDEAMKLEILCLLNKKTQAFTQLKKVSSFLSSNNWLSTQTTAYGLYAVSSFVRKFGGASAMQAVVYINGKELEVKGNKNIAQFPMEIKNGSSDIRVVNNGKGMLYARIVNRGKPSVGLETEGNENISMSITYKDANGSQITPDETQQGKDLIMEVTVKNLGLSGDIQNIALSAYIPGGWEIHNSRMDETGVLGQNYTYQDIKDDRVLTYFDLRERETKTIAIRLNAAYEGRYYLPSINAEAMYDNSVYARTKGQWIKVVKNSARDKMAGR